MQRSLCPNFQMYIDVVVVVEPELTIPRITQIWERRLCVCQCFISPPSRQAHLDFRGVHIDDFLQFSAPSPVSLTTITPGKTCGV